MGITKDFKDGLLWRVLSFFSLIFPVPRQKIRFSGLLSLEKSGADWGADSGRNPASTSYIMLNRSKNFAISTAARQSSFPSAVGIWSGTFRMDASNLPLPGKFWNFDFCQCIYLNVACGVACVCVHERQHFWKTPSLKRLNVETYQDFYVASIAVRLQKRIFLSKCSFCRLYMTFLPGRFVHHHDGDHHDGRCGLASFLAKKWTRLQMTLRDVMIFIDLDIVHTTVFFLIRYLYLQTLHMTSCKYLP